MIDSNRINYLDGLRGLAIITVLCFHLFSRWGEYLSFVEITENYYPFKYGWMGVQLFFMISGYVIFMTLERTSEIKVFLIKRWLRLFPAMLLVSIIVFSTMQLFYLRPAGILDWYNIIPGLLFLHPTLLNAATDITFVSLEGAFWTIYIEVGFYLVSSLVYFLFKKNILIKIIIALFVFSTVYHYSIYFFQLSNSVNSSLIFNFEKLLNVFGFKYYCWFAIGMFVYDLNKRGVKVFDSTPLLALLFISALSMSEGGVEVFIISLLLGAFFVLTNVNNFLKTLLSTKVLVFFGFISYPLYLIHENMMIGGARYILSHGESAIYVFIAITLPVTWVVLLSWVIAKYYEPMFNGLRRMVR